MNDVYTILISTITSRAVQFVSSFGAYYTLLMLARPRVFVSENLLVKIVELLYMHM